MELDLDRIGKCLDGYDRYEGNEGMQNGFAFAMLKECYPEEEDFDSAKRRFFCADGKTTGDVYGYFRKLYDDAKNPSQEVSGYWNTSEDSVEAKYSPEKENDIIKSNKWLSFQHLTKSLPAEIRDMAFGMVFAEGSRADVAQAYVDRLLSMPEKDRNAALWGAYVLNPEVSANFFMRVGTRILENLGDNGFNISNYWEASQKGVNPNTIYDAVTELGAMDENGEIIPEKLPELNKRLNALRAENSIFNDESSQVYAEKIRNAVRRNRWAADHKEYGADFIREEYEKGRRYKEVFKLVSQLRDIRRTKFDRSESWVPETVEDATVVGVDMLKYVAASSIGTLATKNPWGSFALVGAVMYSEFKPQMFNALRHEGNMSVEDANRYANFATSGMIAANYIGYTNWVKALKPSSYLLGADIAKGNARDYFFHALKEVPKGFVRRGGTETASEYMESVVDLATKYWAMEHEGATFEERELWDDFCRDFRDTTRIMPTLMLGSTLIGGGLALNRVRTDSGVGWDLRQLVAPADVVSHNVQMRMAMAQAQKAADDAANVFGSGGAYDFFAEYSRAAGDGERSALLAERFSDEGEREAAKAVLDNIDRIDREAGNAFGRILADAARMNAEETRRLDAAAQKIEEFQDGAQDGPSPRFAMVDALAQRLGMRESVVFLDTQSDIEALGFSPEAAAETMENLDKKGFFNSDDGKIYMLSGHFKNGVDAFRTFVHENGHRVADAMRASPEFSGMLRRVEELAGGEENLRAILPGSYQNEKVQTLAEEYLMRVVERVALEQTVNARQRGVWAFFKERLRKWFGGETFASAADREIAEIARDILRRAESPASETGAEPSRWSAVTPENNGKRAGGVWAVVDADSLVTSTDEGYDDKLQPRNRTRRASTEQTADIAMHLDPDRLGDSTTTDDGAPIVDARGMVISGNGRTLAIRRAYDSEDAGRAEAYKAAVFERASSMGLEVPQDAKRPVLVRVVDDLGGMTLEDFAARSNKSKIAKMSNAETAVNDARRILDANLLEIFFPSDSGDVLAAGNRDFITAFLETVGGREEYIDKNGNLKSNLAPRIRAAVLAAMLNPEKREIIEELLDNPQGWNSLINGLMGCSAKLAKLSGNPEYDISAELSAAVEAYVQVVRGGETVETFVGQQDFTRPELPGESVFLMDLFEKNVRTPSGISGVLNAYYDLAKNIDTSTQDMFGAENPSKIDVLRNAYKKYATAVSDEPRVAWRDAGEPSAEEIQEAKRQYEKVAAKYKGTSLWLKAPNGKPTKLTERQWVQVRTKAFKDWFGNWENDPANASKVVDENGEPMVVYHGTPHAGFTVFNPASYFTANKDYANRYKKGGDNADIYAVYLKIEKPFDTRNSKEREIFEKEFYRVWGNGAPLTERGLPDWTDGSDLLEFIKEKGYDYDGIILDEGSDGGYGENVSYRGESYVPVNSTQIKSATDNAGTFNPENPDIRWRIEEGAAELDARHAELYERYKGGDEAAYDEALELVADEARRNGYDVKVYHGTGADGFNVALADSSKSEYGEGNQAHGRGLYMAANRDTAEGYRRNGIKSKYALEDGLFIFNSESEAPLYEIKNKDIIRSAHIYVGRQDVNGILSYIENNIKFNIELIEKLKENPKEALKDPFLDGYTNARKAIQDVKESLKSDKSAYASLKKIMDSIYRENGDTSSYTIGYKKAQGRVFDWFHNMKPDEMFDEENPYSVEKSPIGEKYKKAWYEDILPILKRAYGFDEGELDSAKRGLSYHNSAKTIVRSGELYLGADRFREIMLKHGIRGITYDGRQDGRCFVSFEGGATVKLQDPFTQDGRGRLIPLSERFDAGNPDMRWRIDDADISDISAKVEKIIDSVSDKKNRHIEVLRKVSDAEADFLLEKTGLDLKGYSHSIDNYSILHILKKHGSKKELQRGQIPVTVEDIRNFPTIVSDYDDVEYVGKSNIGRDTIRFEKSIDGNNVLVFEEMRVGKKLLALSTMYIQKKKKLTSNANASSNTSETLSTSSSFKETENGIENQENNSQLRFLLRQDRTENPVIWASIVLSKEILNGRGITRAKLEKVLPSERFDGSKQNYAIDRAKRIAEKTRLTQGGFAEDLDRAIRKAESDLFWQEEFVENAYRAFSRSGEEYGFAKAKIMQYLKDLKNRELNKVKGYESGDFETDYVKSIAVAMENEPERRKLEDDSAGLEEELEAAEGDFSDEAEIPARPALEHSPVRDIIRNVRMEVTRRVRASDGDENTRREKYRKTLVNILTDAAAELSYGRERERIMGKIAELSQKKYAVIRIKDGERAGETTDNFTLRAENIALRIFNRGVRDTKAALLEKFDRALKNAKAPKRVERDDKRKMAGRAELRAKSIKDIAAMSSEDVDAAVEAAMNAINKADSTEANDFHEKLIDAVQRLEDLQRFGALRDKSRADMAEAVEWVEKFLESETKAQAERVERLKADAEARRKVFIDAVNEMERNANFDSVFRKGARLVFNSASTFKDLVLGLGRAASGEKYKKFRALADKMADDYYAATTRKENEVFRLQEELSRAVEEIYGMNAPEAFRHLLGRSDRLQKYSVQGKPMSVQIALQRLSMAEQESYRHNVYIHCAAKSAEAKSLEDRIAKLEQKLAGGDMDGAQYRADREALDGLRKELAAEENRAVEAYAQKLRSELSEADLRLLDWLRNFYRRERDSLSEANEAVTGLGIPQADPLYTPMKMLREGGTNERVQIVAIVPKSLSPRVPNSLDMDESVGIVDMWQNRVSENAHYKAFSQLNIEWRGVFAHADFHRAVSSKLGENVLNQLLDHFNDIMSVRLLSGLKIEALDKLNGLYAISALGFNLGSGLRQMTGVSAFVNFIGAAECLKYAREALSKDGRRAAIEILNSETGKRRMARGNNQALVEALNNVEDNKFWAWYKRNSMVFNRWGDILPIMTIGQGIYRAKTAEYAKTMPLEKAKERAMAEMWAIAEASQQSPSVMNLGTWQRRGGSFGKSAGLFISSPQLMLSREIAVFNRFNEMRKKYSESPADAEIRADYMAARKEFAKTVFVNHVLVQGGYMMATLLWKAALGDDWDEDDAWAMLAETIAGPLGGLIVFGRFVSAFYSNMGVSAMPIEGFGRTIKSGVDLLQDIMVLDGESVKKDLDKLGRSLFAPYRDVSKAVKNYSED